MVNPILIDLSLQRLFDLGIQASLQPRLGNQHLWYPYTYLFGHLARRAEFLMKHASQLLTQNTSRPHCHQHIVCVHTAAWHAMRRDLLPSVCSLACCSIGLCALCEPCSVHALHSFTYRHLHFTYLHTMSVPVLMDMLHSMCMLHLGQGRFVPSREREMYKQQSKCTTCMLLFWEDVGLADCKPCPRTLIIVALYISAVFSACSSSGQLSYDCPP